MVRRWKKGLGLLAAAVLAVLFSGVSAVNAPVYAANPTTISFQGKVVNADGTNVADGNYTFLFRLYTVASGGSAIWTETQSSVPVTAGIFQVNLGSNCPMLTADACNTGAIDFSATPGLHLGITFNNDPAGEMSPRAQMQSVPFAFNADRVGGLQVSQLVQLSPSAQQTGAININGAGTFGGLISTTSATTGLALTGAPAAGTGITSLLQLGNAISGGNITTNGGTYFGINAPASGAGSVADFINFQVNGVSRLRVTTAGAITAASTIAGTQVNGTTGLYTGPGLGTQRIDSSGNITANRLTVTNGAVATTDIAAYFNTTPVTTTGAHAVLMIGSGFSNPNTGTNGGTYVGVNAPASGVGSAADFLNFQSGGAARLSVSNAGNVTAAGSVTAGSIVAPSLAASGALAISSGSTNNVSIDTGAIGGTVAIGATNATSVELSRTGATTRVKGALQVDQGGTLSGGSLTLNFTGTQGVSISNADMNGAANGVSFVATPSATAGTTNGLFVQQADSANTNGLDNGVTIDNADTNLPIGAAINITNSGGGGYGYLLQSPNLQIFYGGDIVTGGAIQGETVSAGDTISGATVFAGTGQFGTLTATGLTTLDGGLTVDAFSSGSWVNMPTTGPSGIGSGGAGSNAWIGYASGAGNWFTNAAAGDIAYRNTSGRLLFGNSGGNAQTIMSTASTIFQNTSNVALFTVDNTNTRLQVGSSTTDATGVLLVVDSYNNATDPTGVDGSIYYNTALGKFRCYEAAAWRDCLGALTVDKAATQNVTNSATFADATDLSFPVAANGFYTFDAFISFSTTSATADFKYTFNATTASVVNVSATAPTSATASTFCSIVASGQTCALVSTANYRSVMRVSGYIQNGGTAGTVTFRFAQNTAVAGQSATVYQGSAITYQRTQ
jgi:hypothetical protein